MILPCWTHSGISRVFSIRQAVRMHPQDNHRFMLDMRMFELTLRYACCFLSGCFFVCFSHPGASLSYMVGVSFWGPSRVCGTLML